MPRVARADVIVAIDSDLIDSAPGHLAHARGFASRRNPTRTPRMSRVYAIEPTPSLIGARADHRFVAGPAELHRAVLALADGVLRGAAPPSGAPPWVAGILDDLKAAHGRALIHAGPDQPAETHALVAAMNEALGGRDATFDLIAPAAARPPGDAGIEALVADMQAGHVAALLMLDTDPVYAAPGALGFAEALKRVPFSLALSASRTDTSRLASWSVPMTHPWESWSDARCFDGTASILQPQAMPLYGGLDAHRLLALLTDQPIPASFQPPTMELVQATWRTPFTADFDARWHDALATGIVAGTASAPTAVALRPDAARATPPAPPTQPLTILFRPDPSLWDGRHANNGWLQELPRPLTKLTWDNPLLIAPALAEKLGVENGHHATLSVGGQSVTAPIWIMPGQAADCITAPLGGGRITVGTVGEGAGFDLTKLRGRTGTATLVRAKGETRLASTDHHQLLLDKGDDFARHGTLADFVRDPRFMAGDDATPSLYRWHPPGPAAWGMSIDTNACIGCNACVTACQAENNIPVVGKEQVLREREMHWLRIDRYYEGDAADPAMLLQPVLCMHCEQAPCEVVCPVGATVHDNEGLNVMIYNRCVGTRFCSNNCPYKVRRFNYFAFAREEHRPPAARNPDVTVRGRGVMEKCTFCLQRIAEARIAADEGNRPVAEVRTACQAACPTQAFSFGDMAQGDDIPAQGGVLARKKSPLAYALLADQNTHPRVTYEGRIDNPRGGGQT